MNQPAVTFAMMSMAFAWMLFIGGSVGGFCLIRLEMRYPTWYEEHVKVHIRETEQIRLLCGCMVIALSCFVLSGLLQFIFT